MTDEDLNKLAEQLWKRMEPFAKIELERLFTNYMATRTLLEPELIKKLFDAMSGDMHKFVFGAIQQYRTQEHEQLRRAKEQWEKWEQRDRMMPPPLYGPPKKERP